MTEGDWEVWEAAAKHIKENVTDEIIEAAIKKWPANVYAIDGEETIKVLKQRRDDMLLYAKGLYDYLSQKVDVLGTEKKDYFWVKRIDAEHTKVMVFDTNKKVDKIKEVLYSRIFKTSETKEIILYGFGEDDIFEITGEVADGITIRVVGGLGEDTFKDDSSVKEGASKTLIYDAKEEKSNLELGNEAKNLISDRPEFNQYNHRAWDYEMDFAMPIIKIGGNPDDGILLGGSVTFTKYGFKKDPYASIQTLSGEVALETGAFALRYNGCLLYTSPSPRD